MVVPGKEFAFCNHDIGGYPCGYEFVESFVLNSISFHFAIFVDGATGVIKHNRVALGDEVVDRNEVVMDVRCVVLVQVARQQLSSRG